MSTIFESTDQFKSGYDISVFLVPLVVVNPEAGEEIIKLTISGTKSLPGIAEGENWQFTTDNPNQEIGETIVGKFGNVNALSFEVPYDPMLLQKLIAHAKTRFTVRIVYDDTALDSIYRIDVLRCFLTTPGSTSGTANNAAPNMTVTLQPRGGGRLIDCMEITKAPRA